MATALNHKPDCTTGWGAVGDVGSCSHVCVCVGGRARTEVLRPELTLLRGSTPGPGLHSDSTRCHFVKCDIDPYQRTGNSENWIGCCPMSLAVVQ